MEVFKSLVCSSLLLVLILCSIHAASGERAGRGDGHYWYHRQMDKFADASDEARLVKDILMRSMRLVRPVKHVNETVRVSFGMALINLEGIDESQETLNVRVWSRMMWNDMYLTWDPRNYSGINHVRVPIQKIWTPDLTIYNAREGSMIPLETNAVVSSDGSVLFIPPMRISSHCSLDLAYFPMDTQTCNIMIGSWTYDGFKLDLEFYDGLETIDMNDYILNKEWSVISASAKKDVKYYPCCEEPYPSLTFSLRLSRHNEYYQFAFFGPAILLAVLAPFIFLLPPADTQKVMLGVGILICYSLFFNTVAVSLPLVHVGTPLIDKYYMTQYVLLVVSIMLSTLVANIARKSLNISHPPAFIQKVVLSGLGRCLCVSKNMYSDLPSGGEMVERGDVGSDVNHTREWLLIATVIDRLFFLLSIVVTVLMTAIVLNSYPRN